MLPFSWPVNLQQIPVKWNNFSRKENIINSQNKCSLLEDVGVFTGHVKTRTNCISSISVPSTKIALQKDLLSYSEKKMMTLFFGR